MRFKYSIGIVLIAIIQLSNSQGSRAINQRDTTNGGASTANLDMVADSVTNLANKISLAISSPKSKTEIFSPVSIAGALSLLLLGAGGITKNELLNVMGFTDKPIGFTDIHKSFGQLFLDLVSNEQRQANIPWRLNDKCNNIDYDYEDDTGSRGGFKGGRQRRDSESHLIAVANGIFVNRNFQLSARYANASRNVYKGEVRQMEFDRDPVGSSSAINEWVRTKTRDKIREIVNPGLISGIPMVLASSLYFKAKWETMFIELDTKPRPFYIYGREQQSIMVDSMGTGGCFPFYDAPEIDAKLVGLPYKEGKSTMYILLPNNSDRSKLQKLLQSPQQFNLHRFNQMIDKMQVKTGTIVLPKMKLENSVELKQVLQALNVHSMFDPHRSNLSRITERNADFPESTRRQPAPVPIPAAGPIRAPFPEPASPIPAPFPAPAAAPVRAPAAARPADPSKSSAANTKPPGAFVFPNEPSGTVYTPPVENIENSFYPLAVTVDDCNLINNCFFNGSTCMCNTNIQMQRDEQGCYRKPFVATTQCEQQDLVRMIQNIGVCLVKSHTVYIYGRDECWQSGCTFAAGRCLCCQRRLSQGNSNGQQSSQKLTTPVPNGQQNPVTIPSFDVAHRLNPPPPTNGSTFNVGNRFGSSSAPPVDNRLCQIVLRCDSSGRCTNYRICPLVNTQYSLVARVGRVKRQSENQQRQQKLFVGQIIHKVSLDINEQGTEGGAVTAVVLDRISSAFTLRMDGPFLIYIRNDVTKLPLFYGPIYDPSS